MTGDVYDRLAGAIRSEQPVALASVIAEAVPRIVRGDDPAHVPLEVREQLPERRGCGAQPMEHHGRGQIASARCVVGVERAQGRPHVGAGDAAPLQGHTTNALGKREEDGFHHQPVYAADAEAKEHTCASSRSSSWTTRDPSMTAASAATPMRTCPA